MKLLDLFCGAGGAAMGYHRAGFLSYQEAFASGDLESIATELHRRSVERAVERAATANE